MSDSSRLLFLHIPKTAGTSFRLGAVQALGAENCHFDYGIDSVETSSLVREHVYERPDLYQLEMALDRNNARLLGGHFGFRKYAPLFRCERVLAFCRHPAQQLMSHYRHFVRHHGYRHDLATFLSGSGGGGMQTRVFGGLPLEIFGFIGVTERYEESLRVLLADYGVRIAAKFANANPDKDGCQPYSIGEDVAEAYAEAVSQDLGLYRRANALLDARLAALDGGYPYVHGAMHTLTRSSVRGFALRSGDAGPVTVELVVNDRCVASMEATQDRPVLRAVRIARNAYVGFEFQLQDAGPDDRIVVRVASSGQELVNCVMDAKHKSAQK